ncbi:MAG TPA: DivIVA domain-containing protein [Solirubrobacteraceae bacterium]|nr:DivIVA domain-containing protein [Solirubrobacteraceae bacterium]
MTDLDTRHPEFTIAIRGYDRLQVDEYVERLQKLVSEAEDRVRTAESDTDSRSHASIGPRLAEIFELAGAEARELRGNAEQEAKKRVADAKAYAKEIISEARENARVTSEQAATDYETMLTEFEHERDRIRGEVHALDQHRAAILGELRRLHEALGAAVGLVSAPREEPALPAPGSELTTVELPQKAAPVRKAS